MITIDVNGVQHRIEIEQETLLLRMPRDVVGLTDTKLGCGVAACRRRTAHIGVGG